MLIQLFNQNPPINVTGDLIEVRGGSLGTFLIKLGSKGNLEVIVQLYKEEALAVQSKLNEWNPFWKDYLNLQIEELKARVAELKEELDDWHKFAPQANHSDKEGGNMGKLNSRFKKHRVMHIDDSLQPIEVYAVDMIDAAKIAAEIWIEDVPNQVVSSEVICYAVQVEELFNPGGFHYPGYCQGVVSSVWNESLFVLRWEFTEVSDYRGYKGEISRIIREKKYGIK